MDDRQSKVIIKLVKAGTRPNDVLKVLQKIQGLRDIPENLIKNAPCYISQKVALPLAQKVQMYLEQAGAIVSLDEDEQSNSLDVNTDDVSQSSLNTLTHHLSSVSDDDSAFSDANESKPVMEENITYFDVEDSATADDLAAYQESESEEAIETPAAEPPRRQSRRSSKSPRKSSSFPFQQLRIIGIILVVAALLAGGIWWYLSGGLDRASQQYQQSSALGSTGTLLIENPAEAEISLHHVVATRVSEPVPLTGSSVSLPRGDYFLEAKQESQILRYPVYIEGRRHKVTVKVEFPSEPIPEGMAYIPAGVFRMGNKETDIAHFGFPDEVPSIDVYVSAFLMSQYEVTNREYAQFIAEGGYEKSVYWDALLEDWDSLVRQSPDFGRVFGDTGWEAVSRYIRSKFIDTDNRPGPRLWEDDVPPYEDFQDDYPVTGITYYEAAAYCRWLTQKKGKVHRLPTEAEWEKAARSYEGYFFSYGNEYDATRANTESEGPQKVGSYPPNGFGVYDLTGNMWEWISDHYRADAYQFLLDTYKNNIRNPHIFNAAQAYDRRILRGGSFRSVTKWTAR